MKCLNVNLAFVWPLVKNNKVEPFYYGYHRAEVKVEAGWSQNNEPFVISGVIPVQTDTRPDGNWTGYLRIIPDEEAGERHCDQIINYVETKEKQTEGHDFLRYTYKFNNIAKLAFLVTGSYYKYK